MAEVYDGVTLATRTPCGSTERMRRILKEIADNYECSAGELIRSIVDDDKAQCTYEVELRGGPDWLWPRFAAELEQIFCEFGHNGLTVKLGDSVIRRGEPFWYEPEVDDVGNVVPLFPNHDAGPR